MELFSLKERLARSDGRRNRDTQVGLSSDSVGRLCPPGVYTRGAPDQLVRLSDEQPALGRARLRGGDSSLQPDYRQHGRILEHLPSGRWCIRRIVNNRIWFLPRPLPDRGVVPQGILRDHNDSVRREEIAQRRVSRTRVEPAPPFPLLHRSPFPKPSHHSFGCRLLAR